METVLQLLKIDLGITHNLRDTYFSTLIDSCKLEIEKKGIVLDLTASDDIMILSDFSAWRYRNRTDDKPIPKNIYLRLMALKTKVRANYGD